MVRSREVVITGAGVVSPIGVGVEAFWDSLESGVSGIRSIEEFASAPLPVKFGGKLVEFDAKQFIKPRKSIKVMSRDVQVAVTAAALAVEDAKLSEASVDPDRYGVVIGCDFLYCDAVELADSYRATLTEEGEFDFSRWGESAIDKLFPLWMLRFLPNMPACHIGIAQDARGHNNSITLGGASGLLALLESCDVIRRGRADVMLTGGVGTRLNVTPLLFRGDANLSHRNDAPEQACRPFDAERDGMVNGDGSGVIVLESREHAEKRGARILGTILGCSSRFEQTLDGAVPTGAAIRSAIESAVRQAEISLSDIGHVNAHGVSTIESDRVEARAIQRVLGDVPVTALKCYFGNTGAAAAPLELIGSLLGLHRGIVPATLNYSTPDPECPVNVITQSDFSPESDIFLALNQSGTGQIAAAIIRKD
ncbi:MAG: 3-oxoacyl-[acyl-carrier-protein] synthase II [Pirellulaceae bacterium]|jgi:3-oxoacyl-[acyl-carrier-protein] synthase II